MVDQECILHVPHKLWENLPDEQNAYSVIERWSFDSLTTYRPLHIPYKDVPGDPRKANNYLAVERWARTMFDSSTPPLHIPFKDWAENAFERENWSAIERWAHHYAQCFGCVNTPVNLVNPYTTLSFSSTPDATQLVVIAIGEVPFPGVEHKYIYNTSDYTTIIDSAVLANGSPLDPPIVCIAGDDGYFYNAGKVVDGSGTEFQYIWRWPIIGPGGVPAVFATYSGADYFSIRDTYNLTFDTFGHFYTGGKDGPSGEAVLLSLDRTTGARTTLHQDAAWEYFETNCCTLDGAIWGWAIVNTTPPLIKLFRYFGGTMSIIAEFPNAAPGGSIYPLPDNSVAFVDAITVSGKGKRCSSSLVITDFSCLDGIGSTGDKHGPTAPTLVVPHGFVADAFLVSLRGR